jgi:uncharacterized membrane protein
LRMPAFDVRQAVWPAWQLQCMKRVEKLLHSGHCFLPHLLLFVMRGLLPELTNGLGVRVEQGHCCLPRDHPQVSCIVFWGQLLWVLKGDVSSCHSFEGLANPEASGTRSSSDLSCKFCVPEK